MYTKFYQQFKATIFVNFQYKKLEHTKHNSNNIYRVIIIPTLSLVI